MDIVELKQRHVDLFCSKLPQDVLVNIVFYDLPRYAGAIVRAAVAAKWLDFPGDVGESSPGEIIKLAREIVAAYHKSIEISPE